MVKKLFKFILQLPIFQKPKMKAIALHITSSIIIGLSLGLLTRKLPIDSFPELCFGALSLVFILLGYVHTKAMFRIHSWANQNHFLKESAFTILIGTLGAIPFSLMLFSQVSSPFNWIMVINSIALITPFFVNRAIQSRLHIPAQIHPGIVITEVKKAQGLISFAGQHTKKYLKFLFMQDEHGYLPKEAFIPVTKEVEELTFEQILQSIILFNNHSERPGQPILLDFIENEEDPFEFKWFFWQRGTLWNKTFLSPKKLIKDFDFVYKVTEEVDPDGNVRRIETVLIHIHRYPMAIIREPQIQVAHLRITG